MGARQRRRLKTQEPMQLAISKLTHEGRGLSHHEGKVVFVDGALPGEIVLARFTSSRSSYLEARTLEVLQGSSERRVPPCPHFDACGGCSLQHLDSLAQVRFKEEVLHDRLNHAVGMRPYSRLPVITGPVSGYRRKARLAVRWVAKKQKVLVGFREQHSSFITDMDSCLVLDPLAERLLVPLGALLSRLQAREQIPQIEVAVGEAVTGTNAVALVLRHLQPLADTDQQALVAFAAENSVDLYLQPGGPDSVQRIFPTGSPERLFYELPEFGLLMGFHPMDFTQVNAGINRQMLVRAIALLELQATDRVLDLFCGLGNFTLPVARTALHVLGVEGSQAMVERARENALRNQLANTAFHCADLSQNPQQYEFLRQGIDKILLDPPRSGALEVLPALTALRPRRIVYVSCNPATLSRDAARLAELGYSLQAAGAMDMFPHTSHVEAIAVFVPERGRL